MTLLSFVLLLACPNWLCDDWDKSDTSICYSYQIILKTYSGICGPITPTRARRP